MFLNSSQIFSTKVFFDIFSGSVKMSVLKTAVELGIAEIIEKDCEVEKIGKCISSSYDRKNLCYFLDALASMGFCEKKNGSYFNNENSKTYLLKTSPFYMGGMVLNMSVMQHKNLDKIKELVISGPEAVPEMEKIESQEKWEKALDHLTSYQRAGMAAYAADIVESLPGFDNALKLLDLGCGPGIMCLEVLKRNKKLKGVLFDLPGIMKIVEKRILNEKYKYNIEFIGGDYNQDDFGKDYDIIWASHNLYFAKDRDKFFKRVLDSLTEKGVFVCLHEGLEKERTYPSNIVLSRLSLALEGQDVSFEKGEIAGNLLKAGFRYVTSEKVLLPSGECELVKAFKNI